jgi:hypothetical protein
MVPSEPDEPGPTESSSGTEPKYPRPKILVIDAPEVTPALQGRGYAAKSGSFGQPLAVPKEATYLPLYSSWNLPDYTEQGIIVADLARPALESTDEPFELPVPGVRSMWSSAESGVIDPRPGAMLYVRDAMDRIHQHGGVFIIFAARYFSPHYILNERDRYGHLNDYGNQPINTDNWSLLSDLRWLSVSNDIGREMDVADNGVARELGIEGYFSDGRFDCVIKPSGSITSRWATLATSKYGDPVAGVIGPDPEEERQGWIFIFPEIKRRADLVSELVDRVLPALTPRLFPHAEGSRWTRRPEYDLLRVSALKDEIAKIEETTRTHVRELEEQIEAERSQYGFMHDLVTASGDDLVQAVIQALRTIGFEDVRDVDADAEAAGETGPLREDLRIMDAAVPVLVEVKGITGTPKEASTLQVAKYLAPRMREWDRTDICGLAIVNHQRHLPALDREHQNVFQADVLTNAEQQGFALLTTWDLFRMVRGFLAHGWRHEDVAGLFVTPGRLRPIPSHYQLIGTVDGYWPKGSALGLRLESGVLRVGDRVAYELPVDFIEETVTSLRLDDQTIEEANVGDYPGLKTTLSKQQARDGMRVYRVGARA